VVVTVVLTYLAGRRSKAGTVSTTEATELWAQVDKHIKRLDTLIAEQALAISAQGARLAEFGISEHQKDERIMHLEGENSRLKLRVNELELEIKVLQAKGEGAK